MNASAEKNLATFRSLIALFNVLDVETALARHYADDAYYRYGSFPAAVGKDAIRQATYASHLDFVKGMAFTILETWAHADTVIAELELRHDLTDGSTLTLLCTDIVRFDESGRVRDFRVYIDPSPLLARAAPHG